MSDNHSSTREIPLTQGKSAIVRSEDYNELVRYRWHVSAQGYARRYVGMKGKQTDRISMHREIMAAGPGVEIDHKDGNKLNNTRQNLRVSTSQQNRFNMKLRTRKNGHLFKGTKRLPYGRYQARIKFNYAEIYLGVFDTESEAASAYDAKAKELFGEFARLNFPAMNISE